MHEYDRVVLPPARLETDKRECRYSDDGHDIGILQRVVVQSTRLPMFPSDAYEKRYVCSEQGNTGDDGLPPGIKRPQHIAKTSAETDALVNLNESADLFPDESHQSPSTTRNGKPSSTASCSIPSVQSISSASLLWSSATTRRPEEVRSNRETASPPWMTSGDTGYPETTVARRTRNKHLKEMYDDLTTGNGKSNNESNLKIKSKSHVANTLPASAVNRKTGNGIFATAYPSSATRIKCSKNPDYNIKCKDTGSDGQRHDCPPAKTLPRNRQAKQIIQPTTEIAARCEDSAQKCKKALKDMNSLLRTSRIENFWHQWNLQEMGSRIRQSEYNATVMPASMKKQFNPMFHAAYTPRSRVFTPHSGNVKSTTLSTKTVRSRSSPPTYARVMGLTSYQASRRRDELERRHPGFI